MKITDVRIRLADEDKLKGIASITIDECFVVHDLKIIDGKDGLFVAMPNKKRADGEYKDVAHPIKTETRTELKNVVLEAYEKAKAEQAE